MAHTPLRLTLAGLVAGLAATALAAAEHAPPPGYRGSATSGTYPARDLLGRWPSEGPTLLWKQPLGISAAPVTVLDGKVYSVAGGNAYLHVFDLEDGTPLGKAHLGSASWKRFGFARSTPLVDQGLAVGTTPNANLYAVDLETMETRWKVNAWTDFGTGEGDQGWGLPESPILHKSTVIFNPVSRNDRTPPLVAVDIRDGHKIVWGMDPGIGKAYSAGDVSAARFRHGGRNLIVSPTWCYVVCLDADTGKVLWEVPSVGEKTLTPVYADGLLLVSLRRELAPATERAWPGWAALPLDPPYRAAAPRQQPQKKDDGEDGAKTLRDKMRDASWGPEELAMLRLSPDGRTARVLWVRQNAPARFSHAAIVNGRVYAFGAADAEVERSEDGLLPPLPEKPGRHRGATLLCLDAETGALLHTEPAGTPGHVVAADGKVYALDLVRVPKPHDPSARPKQVPRMRLIAPTKDGFEVTGELRPFGFHDVPELRDGEWEANVAPVIAQGRLFFKFGPLMAYDLRDEDFEPLPPPPAHEPPPLEPETPILAADAEDVGPEDVPALIAQLGARLEAHRKAAAVLLARPEVAKAKGLAGTLAGVLASKDEKTWPAQRAAAHALAGLGPKAKDALPDLAEALPEALARRDGTHARLLLATMREIDPPAARTLTKPVAALLEHKDTYVRYLAAGLLKRMGSDAADAAVPLAGTVKAEDARLWHEAAAALQAIGPDAKEALPALCEALVESLREKRTLWCDTLLDTFAAVDPAGLEPVVPRIARMLGHEDADLRQLAAATLRRAGAAGEAAIPGLVEALASEDEKVRDRAASALAAMDAGADQAAGALAKVIAKGEDPLRRRAAAILVRMGPAGAPAVDALVRALGDENLEVAKAAAKALGAIGPDAEKAAGPLAETLKHEDRELARAAAEALGGLGPSARSAADALFAALDHSDRTVRGLAAASLDAIGRSPVPALVAALEKGSGRDRPWAAEALAAFPEGAETSVPALARMLDAEDKRLASSALSSLRALGPKAKAAVPALLEQFHASDTRRAGHVLSALAAVGPAAAEKAVPVLVKIVRSKGHPLLGSAVRTLSGMGPAAAEAVEPLVALSRGADKHLGKTIQRTLDRIKTENAPPEACDAKVACPEGKSVAIDLPMTDPDDVVGHLRVHVADGPRGGSVDRAEWGTITYHSRAGFVGTDTFTYRASDRGKTPSRPATVTVDVEPDTRAPRVAEVAVPLGEREALLVAFDEPVTPETATDPARFEIDRGVRVRKAVLHEDGQTVTLTTSALQERTAYTLSVAGVRDRAKAANAGGGQARFAYRPLIEGLTYAVYEDAPDLDGRRARRLAYVDSLEMTPRTTGVTAKLRLPEAARGERFTVRFDGVLDVPRRDDGAAFGGYTFATRSTGASRVYVDERLVVESRGGGGQGHEEERSTSLAAGRHPFTVLYTHAAKTPPVLEVRWAGPTFERQSIPGEALFHQGPAPALWERGAEGP